MSAALSLAGEEDLTAAEIVDLEGVEARLVVMSACQTGVIQGYVTADEVTGLPAAFLSAGAAAAIASLWPVDDYATALLMCRFYEILEGQLESGWKELEPVAALREAQLWLRVLTAPSEDEYVKEHPSLRPHREAPHRRHVAGQQVESERPYAAPELWAAFTFVGA